MLLGLSAVLFVSCGEDESAGKTWITYYPSIELTGGDVYINVGDTYTEPGYMATMNGEDISDQVVVSSDVDTSEIGIYTVTYSAENEDGFSASTSRTVYVVNQGSIATLYYGESEMGTRHYYNAVVAIYEYGSYNYIDDLLADIYNSGRYPGYEAYDYDFHLEAILDIQSDGAMEVLALGSDYWGWESAAIADSSLDEDGNIYYELDLEDGYATMYIHLTPITAD